MRKLQILSEMSLVAKMSLVPHVTLLSFPPQHVQLLTQIHLLAASNLSLSSEANTTKIFLVRFQISIPKSKFSRMWK